MTSLATLAHAAAAPPSPFNSAFYATVATVIPVLYVALAFQGRSLQSLLSTNQALATQARKTVRHIRPNERDHPLFADPADVTAKS